MGAAPSSAGGGLPRSKSGRLEPISPELALIDPELARADLARLAALTDALESSVVLGRREAAPAFTPVRIPVATEGDRAGVSPPWYMRLVWATLLVSLSANGFAVAMLAAGHSSDRPVLVAVSPTTKGALQVASAAAKTSESSRNSRPLEAATVERKILSLVVQSPRKRLLPALVDQRTGLAKNNLQAVCDKHLDAYLCVVRPAHHRPGEGLYVRYRPGTRGRGSFTWYPYRHG